MARLERMSSAQGRRQLAGRQAMQSVRDGLEEMRRPSMRERAEIAAAALDGALQRAATQPTPPAPPLKRTLTAPRSAPSKLRPQEAAQELSRTLSISDEATQRSRPKLYCSPGPRGAVARRRRDRRDAVAKSRAKHQNSQRRHDGYRARVPIPRAASSRRRQRVEAGRRVAPRDHLQRACASSASPSARASWPWPAARGTAPASRRRAACCAGVEHRQCGDSRKSAQPRAVQGAPRAASPQP